MKTTSIDQGTYYLEVVERMTPRQRKKYALADLSDMTDREQLIAETAYRRGFYQGFWGCLRAVRENALLSQLTRFMNARLYKWRFAKHGGKLTPPPELTVS